MVTASVGSAYLTDVSVNPAIHEYFANAFCKRPTGRSTEVRRIEPIGDLDAADTAMDLTMPDGMNRANA